MATTRIRYVNTASTGGDGTTNNTSGATAAYAGLRAALTAEFSADPDLTSADIVLKIFCEGSAADSSGSSYTLPAFVTDTTRYLWLITDPSVRHAGKYDTGKYRLTSGAAAVLVGNTTTKNIRMDGIQIVNTNTASGYRICISYSNPTSGFVLTMDSCIFHATGTSAEQAGSADLILLGAVTNKAIRATNCQFSGRTENAIKMVYIGSGGVNTVFYNCVFYGMKTGVDFGNGNTGKVYFKNNVLQRYSGSSGSCIIAPTGWGATATNLTDDSTSPNGSSYQNKQATFEDAANFDFHLGASDTVATDKGTDLSGDGQLAFSTDIDGATRTGTWDCGVDQNTLSAGRPPYEGLVRGLARGLRSS